MCGVYPAADAKTAGDQISSTYEGRHLTMRDDELLHKYTGSGDDGFVDKGDAVILAKAGNGTHGRAVGVAFLDGAASADLIPVDTEGIFALLVYADDDDGGSEVVPGDALFIDTATVQEGAAGIGIGCLSKRRNLVTQIPFGYALGNIDSGDEGVIAVKVHWDPEEQQEERIVFIAGSSADDAKRFKIYDASTLASGLSRGLGVDFRATGDKTGTAEVNASFVDLTITGNTPYAYCHTLYVAQSGNPTIGYLAMQSFYMDNIGTAVVAAMCIDLQIGVPAASAPSETNRWCYIRARKQSTGRPNSIWEWEGNDLAAYFINAWGGTTMATAPFITEDISSGRTIQGGLMVRFATAGVTGYIPIYLS